MNQELKKRGLISDTAGASLAKILSKKRNFYLGVDPTADSVHLGHLVPIILMKHLSDLGFTPYILVGGATGMIGDPRESGERALLDLKTVNENSKTLKKQLTKIVGDKNIKVIDNRTWLSKLSLLDFLRDTGKHFTVNQLIKRDIIKRRLENEQDSISYTEFSYSLLQAYDYLHLHLKYGIDLQIGGSDQWANIVSGVDLIRRKQNTDSFAITTPIITDRSTGKKFGKSEGNAIWLDADKTSPFSFYQFWLNVSDENVLEYLKIFTFLPLKEISKLVRDHKKNPQNRKAQKSLAFEVTKFVHGEKTATSIKKISETIYDKDIDFSSLSKEEKKIIAKEMPSHVVKKTALKKGISVIEILTKVELVKSKSEARRLLTGNAISLNNQVVNSEYMLDDQNTQSDMILIKRGKKTAILLIN